MKYFTKKRVVLFLLFIFPLICFLILSTGQNNFTKLPVITENITDIIEIDATNKTTLKNHVSVICFLGDDISSNKTRLLNLNEKVYKKFIDYKEFQIIAIYPKGKETEVEKLQNEIAAFTDMQKWIFVASEKEMIQLFYKSFSYQESLENYGSTKAFIIDKNSSLRGRINDKDAVDGKLIGYNMNSVSELKDKLKDDISVLYYEYYAAFKDRNKNKANRKEVGL